MTEWEQHAEVAFQGEPGAYSEAAVYKIFGPTARPKPCKRFSDVFRDVWTDTTKYGVVPIENSIEGSVSQVYDLFTQFDLNVCGELPLRISHCLIANPGTVLKTVKVVYSHPQALGQCRDYLERLGIEMISTYDTAGSVNYTRFFVLSKDELPPTGSDKTSIIFSTKHIPGALYESLGEFATRDINMTKIESRPTRQNLWEYNFYLDFEGHIDEPNCAKALEGLKAKSLFVKVLGSYPRGIE
ncbi:MAG: prephenate dehydratase [Candidatus Thorarchaeota archaeon]